MPPANNRKRQNVFRRLGFALTNSSTTMYYTRAKLGKIETPKTFCRTQSKNFHAKVEYYNMENKILDFQFRPVCANQTRPNCSVGSEQDEAEIQYDRWSAPEWCNCENVKRNQPVKNACVVTKFRQLRHFI